MIRRSSGIPKSARSERKWRMVSGSLTLKNANEMSGVEKAVLKGRITMIHIFLGFDEREAIAYHTCVNSIIRHSTAVVAITPLALRNLSTYKESHTDGSNAFIYTRFLVPSLMNYKGWALFMDGDMVLRDDLSKLWSLRDETKAVQCVQHEYQTRQATK